MLCARYERRPDALTSRAAHATTPISTVHLLRSTTIKPHSSTTTSPTPYACARYTTNPLSIQTLTLNNSIPSASSFFFFLNVPPPPEIYPLPLPAPLPICGRPRPSRAGGFHGNRKVIPRRLVRREVGAAVPRAPDRHVRAPGSSGRHPVPGRTAAAAV